MLKCLVNLLARHFHTLALMSTPAVETHSTVVAPTDTTVSDVAAAPVARVNFWGCKGVKGAFSNFYPVEITIDGKTYGSTEVSTCVLTACMQSSDSLFTALLPVDEIRRHSVRRGSPLCCK